MQDWSHPIVVEETYRATPDRVWTALTVRDHMVEWYFDKIEAFEPRVGFEARFTVSTGEREFVHVWTVTETRENERLAYRWRYDNYDGDGNVTFEISEQGEGTKLRLTAVVTEPFLPADLPEFQRESGVAGWRHPGELEVVPGVVSDPVIRVREDRLLCEQSCRRADPGARVHDSDAPDAGRVAHGSDVSEKSTGDPPPVRQPGTREAACCFPLVAFTETEMLMGNIRATSGTTLLRKLTPAHTERRPTDASPLGRCPLRFPGRFRRAVRAA